MNKDSSATLSESRPFNNQNLSQICHTTEHQDFTPITDSHIFKSPNHQTFADDPPEKEIAQGPTKDSSVNSLLHRIVDPDSSQALIQLSSPQQLPFKKILSAISSESPTLGEDSMYQSHPKAKRRQLDLTKK